MLMSDEQARIVRSSGQPATFTWVDLPVDPGELPPWVTGSQVHWLSGYCTSPHVSLKTWRYDDPRLKEPGYAMPGWYRQERPGFFVDRHSDGRVHHLSHSSPVEWIKLEKFLGYEKDKSGKTLFNRPVKTDYQDWATLEKQGGFGGSTFSIREVVCGLGPLTDPAHPERYEYDQDRGWWRWVQLRGPWHSGPPQDCVECGSSMGGLTITRELMIKIFAAYNPDHRLALVTESGVTTLDPVHRDWGVPKQMLGPDHPARCDFNSYPRSA